MSRRVFLQALGASLTPVGLEVRANEATAPFTADDLAHARRLRDDALNSQLAWILVSSLVRDVGPRAAGSPGDAKAVAWALDRMRELGLANARAEPVPLTAWQRGATTATLLAPRRQPMVVVALGNSIGGRALETEVAYYSDFAALRADTTDRARGRIVFIDQKMERTRDGSGYGRAVLARVAGAVEAARRGAIAVAIRSIGTDQDRIAHTGAVRYDPQVAAIPAVAVSIPDADLIGELHAGGQPLRMQLTLEETRTVTATSHNVIGEVPGTDLADEVVLISGHLDTWDISPGALDNGSGCAISMAAAKVLLDGGRRPRRTVRVVLFANEENGLDGARVYAERYKDVTHQLVGESDFGADRIWRMRSRVAPAALPAMAAIGEVLKPLGIATGTNDGRPGPDAGVLMRARNWPAIDLTQDGTRYFDVHHTVADTLDKIDPATLPQNIAAWAVVAWLAAQTDQRFGPLA